MGALRADFFQGVYTYTVTNTGQFVRHMVSYFQDPKKNFYAESFAGITAPYVARYCCFCGTLFVVFFLFEQF